MKSCLENAYDLARQTPRRVVFPEWEAEAVVAARETLVSEGLCTPIPVTDPTDAQAAALIEGRGMKPGIAARMLSRPMMRAAAMVAAGEADAVVAGVETPTKKVLEAAGIAIGLAEGVSTASSFFLMRFPDGRELIFSDCAVAVDPGVEELVAIATASAASAEKLLGRADVAMLSYSTGGSGVGPSVDRVREAAERAGVMGPVQADAALNATIASRKGVAAGNANVLIFPSLDAGNIAYKLCQELGGAQAVGPLLQGYRHPVCDLSRGARPDDIVASTALTLALL